MIDDTYVPGKGPFNPKIVFVGEAPSYDEIKSLTPFTGPSGKFFDQILRDVGINRADCWVTNVCKYMVTPNNKNGRPIPFVVRAQRDGIDINAQIDELRREITQLNPNIIVPLGGTALWAITGKKSIKSFRGSIISGMGHKVIGTYHPAHILYSEGEVKGYWNKQIMAFDLKRAKVQSEFPDVQLPIRSLQIAKSSYQFADFIARYKTAKNPAIDIEARSCIPICIGISFLPHEGITIPLWNVNGISDLPTAELINLWKLLADFLASQDVIGQNFGYDRDKLKRLGLLVRALRSDTMLKAFTINPELPKSLAFNTSIYTEEPYYKDEGMYEGTIDDLLIGCARDACVTKEIDLAMDNDLAELGLTDFYRNFILPLHGLYAFTQESDSIEQTGIAVDEGIRKELIQKYIAWDERIRYDLFKLTGEYINTSSPKQVSELLYNKWKLPIRQGTGEEILTQLLNNTVKREEHKVGIGLILESRRVKKTIGTYLLTPSDFDGRMRTSFFICLETGRSATMQQEPPVRPYVPGIDENGKKCKRAIGMAFQTITKHGDIGQDIRKMLVPDKGCVFIQADLSQAEARVVTLLADDLETLKLYDEHDIHAITASWFFGGTESDYSKKLLGYESPYRFAGKTLRHAGHLGASKRRASIELNTQARKNKIDFQLTELAADKALKIFHARFPKLKQVFHNGIIEALNKNRRLTAPVPYGIDASKGGTRIFYERWGDELNRQAFSYIPQRTVSEHVKAAGLRIRKDHRWIRIINEAHDALLLMVPEARAEECASIVRDEMQKPIDFSTCTLQRGMLVIPSDIEYGYNYMELSKFKFKGVQ